MVVRWRRGGGSAAAAATTMCCWNANDGGVVKGTKNTYTYTHTPYQMTSAAAVFGGSDGYRRPRWADAVRGVLCAPQYRGKTTPPRSSAVARYRRRLVGYITRATASVCSVRVLCFSRTTTTKIMILYYNHNNSYNLEYLHIRLSLFL